MYKEKKKKSKNNEQFQQELIENLNLSMDNISGNKDKHIDDSSKAGDYLSAQGSIESTESEFSIAPEVI